MGKEKIYIGRENKQYNLPESPLGNPYVINRNTERKQVIKFHKQYLWNHLKLYKQNGDLNIVVKELLVICDRVKKGESITLTCWCHPQKCLGDVIVRCVNWMIANNF